MSARAERAARPPRTGVLRRRGPVGPRAVPRADSHLVLAPSRTWGVGDQAALDSYLGLTAGPVTLVTGAKEGPALADRADRVAVHPLPALLEEQGRPRRDAVASFLGLLDRNAHCTVLASEEAGGGQASAATAGVAVLARAAAERGLDTRVIGFSWPLAAGQRAVRALRSATRAGATFFVYDDLDRIRAMNDGIDGLRRAVDLRFAGFGLDGGVVAGLGIGDGPVALVDASARGLGGADPTADVMGVVAHLQRRGIHVLLLPQDLRESSGDLALCERVAQLLGRSGVQVVGWALRPSELRALADRARVVVTGRAAVAVLASTCAVPVVGLSADRAVAGVLRLTGDPERCVQPRLGFAPAVGRLLDQVLDADDATAAVRHALPELVPLARASLDGLPAAGAHHTSLRASA
jgi:colanic acid/amylovoran biosynthesis protein